MKQLYEDLWQTVTEHPLAEAPDAVSNAYLLVREKGNVLFYNIGREAIGTVADEEDIEGIQNLGGVVRQYLGHVHEVSPSVARIRERLGAKLCCHLREADAVREAAGLTPDVTFTKREMHLEAIEVIPVPGHTPGSACYLYKSPHRKTYLFTGDTLFLNNGVLEDGYISGVSNKADLRNSIEGLRSLNPDVVISAAAIGGATFKEISPAEWQSAIETTLRDLS